MDEITELTPEDAAKAAAKKAAKAAKLADTIGGIGSGVMDSIGAVSSINANIKEANTMDEMGNTGKVDTLGNTASGAAAGAKLGSAIPGLGPLGTIIGGALGGGFGLVKSLVNKGPSVAERAGKRDQFLLTQSVNIIA